ncbi:hypothetical protein ACIO8H_28380 [Streptomyces sp. NPDC087226]|uniref:hypothetical protein n=1 Tax=Streptomyces sp. NPDC087226 TaxID=3365771 RepID=UPI003805779B
MHSSAFPWLSNLTGEQAYEFQHQVIRAAQDAGTGTLLPEDRVAAPHRPLSMERTAA